MRGLVNLSLGLISDINPCMRYADTEIAQAVLTKAQSPRLRLHFRSLSVCLLKKNGVASGRSGVIRSRARGVHKIITNVSMTSFVIERGEDL